MNEKTQAPRSLEAREKDNASDVAAEEYAGLGRSLTGGDWTARSAVRLFSIFAASSILIPLQALLHRVPGIWWPVAGLWHRTTGWLMGVRV